MIRLTLVVAFLTTVAGCREDGCGGTTTCPFAVAGYATITGVVQRANGAPYVRETNDAIIVSCPGFAFGESTDTAGRYTFRLRAYSPDVLRIWCSLRAGIPVFAQDSVEVFFRPDSAAQNKYIVNLREPGG